MPPMIPQVPGVVKLTVPSGLVMLVVTVVVPEEGKVIAAWTAVFETAARAVNVCNRTCVVLLKLVRDF